jgi:predicted secreted protein
MAVLGNNIFIATSDATLSPDTSKIVAGTRSNTISTECGSIEIASATQQEWEEFIAGRKSWSTSVDWLLLANADVQKVLKAGTFVTISVKAGSTQLLTGRALITKADLKLGEGNLATGSFALKGSGALSIPSS